jgi:hypothetical protein
MGELAGVYDADDSEGWTLEHVELYPHPVIHLRGTMIWRNGNVIK